jgi:hypothetical protein
MRNIKKSKIFWTNVVGFLVIILGTINPDVLTALGFTDHGKFISIIGLISTALSAILRTFFHTPIVDDTLKIGGRPPREKKPTGVTDGGYGFIFDGNDFKDTDEVYYTNTIDGDQFPLTISQIRTGGDIQEVFFRENIEFKSIEDLTFYIL